MLNKIDQDYCQLSLFSIARQKSLDASLNSP